jgi:hypothetical protein
MTSPLDDPPTGVQYSEAEIVRILRMAAELDGRSTGRSKPGTLSLAEIEQIAVDVGIEPRHVATAAALVATEATERWRPWLGVPVRGDFSRMLPGSVPASAWPEVIASIRQRAGRPGEYSYVPGALEWVHTDGASEVRVEVSSSHEGAHVQLSADHRQAAVLYLTVTPILGACAGLLAIVALGLGHAVEPGLFLGGGAVTGFAVGWSVLRTVSARWRRRLRGVMESLAELTASGKAVDS